MDLGLVYFPTDLAVDPVTLGLAAEEAGFDALFVTEHTHMPVDHSPYPRGGPLPEEYRRTYDPFVALSMVAATTERLIVGTGICLVAQHDPIVLAKQVASLQTLSGGRFVFGIGAGWNEPELLNHGTDPATRFAVMQERVEAMRLLWTVDEAEYHGRYVDFDPVWSWPKPARPVPVIVGGWGRTVADRVAAYGDGWFPFGRGDLDELAARIGECRRKAAEAGRSDPLTIVVYGANPRREALERYRDMEVDIALFALPAEAPEDTLQRVQELAELLD